MQSVVARSRTAWALIALGTMLASPLALALPVGVDAEHVSTIKASGATPAYGQVWAGAWMEYNGWGGFESELRQVRDAGATPVVMWYYWGDQISVNAVKYGVDGRSKSEWDSYARTLASKTKAIVGDREFLVVLEPEFNKNGVQHWEDFDGYLASQAYAIKGIAPKAKVVVGFGYWGGWDRFDRAMNAAEYSGFQLLRGSTRDSTSVAEGAADQMLQVTKSLKARFGKPVFMYDLAISTYGGWEGVQERAIQRVAAKRAELASAGMVGLVWRYVEDNTRSSGYFGPAEAHWGVKYSWGGKKPAYDDLVNLVRAGGASVTPTFTSSTSTSTTSSSAFSNVKGNEWWIQANAASGVSSVSARVNGGPAVALKWQSWGAWAVSTHAPTGSTVELIAKFSDGRTAAQKYAWPSATPVDATSSSTSSGSAFDAQFANVKGNDWWIQADVTANEPLKGVSARVNGGSPVPLHKQSWGAWATSTRVPYGSTVEIIATSTDGDTDRFTKNGW